MLKLTILMNSSIEEILDFKCCHVQGMNLEFHLTNEGKKTISAPDSFVLEQGDITDSINLLYPPWPQMIQPNTRLALYCNMDETIFEKYSHIRFFTPNKTEYCFRISECR